MNNNMNNTLCVINSCFSKEIYNEESLFQKIKNIYFFADNYLDSSSKICLINDGPIDISIDHNKINIITSKKRLGRDVDTIKKFVTGLNYFIESDYETFILLLDDFYIFPSFVTKLKNSNKNIILSKFDLNKCLFEIFLFVKNDKNFIINLIKFLSNYDKSFDESLLVNYLNKIELNNSEKIDFNLIKSFRPHKNFKNLTEEEIKNYAQYDLLYQSIGFDGGVYGKDIFFNNTI